MPVCLVCEGRRVAWNWTTGKWGPEPCGACKGTGEVAFRTKPEEKCETRATCRPGPSDWAKEHKAKPLEGDAVTKPMKPSKPRTPNLKCPKWTDEEKDFMRGHSLKESLEKFEAARGPGAVRQRWWSLQHAAGVPKSRGRRKPLKAGDKIEGATTLPSTGAGKDSFAGAGVDDLKAMAKGYADRCAGRKGGHEFKIEGSSITKNGADHSKVDLLYSCLHCDRKIRFMDLVLSDQDALEKYLSPVGTYTQEELNVLPKKIGARDIRKECADDIKALIDRGQGPFFQAPGHFEIRKTIEELKALGIPVSVVISIEVK